jgi:glutamate formiminotransferase/formiminotetrahydrofolate cyclodeaminase
VRAKPSIEGTFSLGRARRVSWHAATVPEIFDSAASVRELLDGLEAAAPSPAGGTAAAVVAAMAASLVVMAGRQSPAWPDGETAAADAETLRDRLLALGAADVQAFASLLSAYRNSDARASREALIQAAEVPLEIAECAADVAELAARAAVDGKRPLQPDAEAAAILAEAAARAAALVVRVNATALTPGSDDSTRTRLLDAALVVQARASAAGG